LKFLNAINVLIVHIILRTWCCIKAT